MNDLHRAAGPTPLGDFLTAHHGDILATWEAAVRRLPGIGALGRLALRDHVPELLHTIGRVDLVTPEGSAPLLPEREVAAHARQRVHHGIDLGQVVAEYGLLRQTIGELWSQVQPQGKHQVLLALNRVIDEALTASVVYYTEARDRSIGALNGATAAAMRAPNLAAMLDALLQCIVDASPAIDCAAIALREGQALPLHAAVGLPATALDEPGVLVGEGFVGTVAASGAPVTLLDGSRDACLRSASLRAAAMAGYYAVPLSHDDAAVGVALVGSRSASDLSQADKVLLAAMASRAAALTALHLSRQAAQQRADRLQVAEARSRLATDIAELGTWQVLPARGEVHCDARCLGLLGLPPNVQPDAAACQRAVHPEDAPAVMASLAPFVGTLTDVPWRAEFRVAPQVAQPTRWLLVQARATARDPTGRPTCVVGTAMDVSERHRAAAAERDRADFSEELMGIVSHDLRSPIAAIDLTVDHALRRGPLSTRLAQQLTRVRHAAGRARRLIDDLLDFSRARIGGGLPIRRQAADLGPCAERVVEEARMAHPAVPIGLCCRGPVRGSWDTDRIAQALANLVANGIEHGCPEGPVNVRLHGDAAGVTLLVHNRGGAIDPGAVPSLFVSARARRPRAGAGRRRVSLGLSIVWAVIDAHGGRLRVRSGPRLGTAFRARLPH